MIYFLQIGGGVDDVLSGLFGGGVSLIFWSIFLLLIFFIIGIAFWYFIIHRRKFDIMVKVTSERANDRNKEYFDKAAILHDRKNKRRYLRLSKTKVDLQLPKFNLFRSTNKGDYIEILRLSEKNFRYLTPPNIAKNMMVKNDNKLYPITTMDQKQIENDINWILQRERENKRIIDPEGVLSILLQNIPQIISGVISLFVLWMVFRYAPEWLGAMRDFAETIKSANPDATVIGSIIGGLSWKKSKF